MCSPIPRRIVEKWHGLVVGERAGWEVVDLVGIKIDRKSVV